jgi:surface protein
MSSFDTSNVKEFSQMFEACYSLEEIVGMENWDTSEACTFTEMFSGCRLLKELDLSGFDTGSAYDNYKDMNNSYSNAFTGMFSGVSGLEKLTVSDDIVYLGNGNVSEAKKLTFPAPAAVAGGDGKWYNVETGVGYLPSEIPEGVAATYVAVNPQN